MSTVNELRTQRAKSWEKANAFLIAHRDGKGILSAVDTATYEAMEQEIVNLGREIERQERLDAMEREIKRICETSPYRKSDCLSFAKQFSKEQRYLEYIELYKKLCNE